MRAKYALAGAFSFWGPGLLFAALTGRGFADFVLEVVKGPVLRLTIATLWPALLCLLVYFALLRYQHQPRVYIAAWMLVGVWCLGSLFILLTQTVLGAGLRGFQSSDLDMLLLVLAIPLVTFILSTYDGTLFALLLVTIALPLCGAFCEKRQPSKTSLA